MKLNWSKKQENVHLRVNTILGCGPLKLEQFWCRRQQFPAAICSRYNAALSMHKATFPMQSAAFGARPRWAVQRLSKVVGLGGGVGVGGVRACSRLRACRLPSACPGTEPSRGPQPIILSLSLLCLPACLVCLSVCLSQKRV